MYDNVSGELMDALALVNSAINFILYCAMSRQFRTTFAQLFRPRLLAKWLPVPLKEAMPLGDTDANGLVGDKTQMTQVPVYKIVHFIFHNKLKPLKDFSRFTHILILIFFRIVFGSFFFVFNQTVRNIHL